MIKSNRQVLLILIFYLFQCLTQTKCVLYALLFGLEKEREKKTFTNRPTKPFRAPAFTVAFKGVITNIGSVVGSRKQDFWERINIIKEKEIKKSVDQCQFVKIGHNLKKIEFKLENDVSNKKRSPKVN